MSAGKWSAPTSSKAPPMTDKTTELRACPNPWCSSHGFPEGRPTREYDIWEYQHWYRVHCPSCPMKGPHAETEEGAVDNWNTRTPRLDPETVEACAKALVDKLDLMGPDPGGAFTMLHIHGMGYTGPTYADELSALRRALVGTGEGGGDG